MCGVYLKGLWMISKFFKSIFTIFSILLVFALPMNTEAATSESIKQSIIKQAVAMGVDPAIMLSIAKTESGFRQEARGGSGCVGVFQLMPATAKRMGYNAYNLDENIKAGITYYKNMYKTFGSVERAVAAYNLGPEAVKRSTGVPSSAKYFVARIMKDYEYFKKQI